LVNRADDDLDALLDYAYGEQLGYLTACPTNVGTGLRVSVLVHLPALVLMKQVRRVLAGATQIGFAVRGFYGEGSDVVGNFFQISNQRTLGEDEREILDSLKRIAQQVLSHEAKSRDTLLAKVRLQIEDKVYRALGTLKYARSLAMQEVLGLASAVRFGVSLGFGGLPGLRALNAVVFTTQPAHLQLLAGRELDAEERKVFRAERVRAILGAGRGAGGTSDA
jgi:protein arginine kinase